MTMTMKWTHVGGGCLMDPSDADDPKYPCDDQYEDASGNWAYFDSTVEAHLSMPVAAASLEEIKALPGVKFRKIEPPVRD